MRVYYMTFAKSAEVILKERRLKLARFGELNDPFELSLIDSRPRDTRRVGKLITDHFHKTIGVICFGANWASPVMWAHYAGKHVGVALGFDVSDGLLTKIDYTDRKINVSFGAHLPMHGLSEEDPASRGPHASKTMSFLAMDDPAHLRLRTLVSKGFTPRRIRELEPRVTEYRQRLDIHAGEGDLGNG